MLGENFAQLPTFREIDPRWDGLEIEIPHLETDLLTVLEEYAARGTGVCSRLDVPPG